MISWIVLVEKNHQESESTLCLVFFTLLVNYFRIELFYISGLVVCEILFLFVFELNLNIPENNNNNNNFNQKERKSNIK